MTAIPDNDPATTKSTEQSQPVITRSQITWRGERLFDAGPLGRTHRIDGHAKQAPGPVETLLNALAACSSVDVIAILGKRRTPVDEFAVELAAERRPELPRRVQRLDIEFRIRGAGITREDAERAIHLALERYCSVASSLSPDIMTHAQLTLNGESFPPVQLRPWVPPDRGHPAAV